ncbi:TPA: hypothetical protein N0F65_000366 [Lagenidium giganteum]|uniref:SET domain-containing protein n=1 Tax=Lagenidium giganteum TaxID=4803 RepID=A0AAV2Z2V3_9STRA|nr:TPA: hypothetical protein N0F65_000366 [Lagenidium giganteum]
MKTGAKIGIRKALFVLLNALSTVLTLLTGLRENHAIVYLTGRYDHIRARLRNGEINYDHIIPDMISKDSLPNLQDVSNSYRFISAPERTFDNLNEDRSTCMRVNSMNTTLFTVDYDDVFGAGRRRAQRFLYSISVPNCDIINLSKEWYNEQCIHVIGGDTNDTKCHEFIFDNFADLKADRLVYVGVEKDFGTPGIPFLKCRGRNDGQFEYITDLMNHQQFWSGGSFHIEIQSSHCVAVQKLHSSDWVWSLFKTEAVNQNAMVVAAVKDHSWLSRTISYIYGLVAITQISLGTFSMVLQSRFVRYIPYSVRFSGVHHLLRYLFPSMKLMALLPHTQAATISLSGATIVASNVWMNHWLYIGLSSIDAAITIRSTYLVFEMGMWMLTKKQNAVNFIFFCSALTKMTWFMCLVHSVMRYLVKLLIDGLSNAGILSGCLRDQLIWYVDGIALFMSYKLYSLWLCVVLLLYQAVHGSTTLMKRIRQTPESTEINSYWDCEIIIDHVTILGLLTATGILFGLLMLQTKYRAIVDNHFIRLLQDRYVFVGWDVFVATEALGLDPYAADEQSHESVASCSFGCVLQQLMMSGPSGLVDLAGDTIFLERKGRESGAVLRYPPAIAESMGLCAREAAHRSVDQENPGMFVENAAGRARTFIVHDALSELTDEKTATLLGNTPLVSLRGKITARRIAFTLKRTGGRFQLRGITNNAGDKRSPAKDTAKHTCSDTLRKSTRTVVAIDLDHTLANFADAVVEWHNENNETKVSVKDLKWDEVWEQLEEERRVDFYNSVQFTTKVTHVEKASEVLKPLRKYFTLYVVTDRPRLVEKQTREWIDTHFSGVFDKLLFVDEDSKDDIIPRKKEIYEEFKVKVAVGSDGSILTKAAEDVPRALLVGNVPWTNEAGTLKRADDWTLASKELLELVQQLQLKPIEKVFAGPKLSRYTDDLVTVSTKKPAVFYANIINSKFNVQRQEVIRLQASEAAITTAVQTAELLRLQNNATTTKISTRYVFKRVKGSPGHRVPKIDTKRHMTASLEPTATAAVAMRAADIDSCIGVRCIDRNQCLAYDGVTRLTRLLHDGEACPDLVAEEDVRLPYRALDGSRRFISVDEAQELMQCIFTTKLIFQRTQMLRNYGFWGFSDSAVDGFDTVQLEQVANPAVLSPKVEIGHAPVLLEVETTALGLFAIEVIHPGEFIGEYTGMLMTHSAGVNKFDSYGVSYPSCFEEGDLYVSASEYGNATRCINHSFSPSARFVPMIHDGILRIFCFAISTIAAGEQIFVNYGPSYWETAGITPIDM